MRMDGQGVISALRALAAHLDHMAGPPIGIIVCGGSALQVLGLVQRSTRDVDVLAIVQTDEHGRVQLTSAEPLPSEIASGAAMVARDLGLDPDWLNPGPAQLLEHGLPEGLWGRVHSRHYGSRLTVHFLDRVDQICLKLYAVVNGGGGGRHQADLYALHPSHGELGDAARWCLSQDASEHFPGLVASCLRKIGYPDVADGIEI